jgi:hypothetical protein
VRFLYREGVAQLKFISESRNNIGMMPTVCTAWKRWHQFVLQARENGYDDDRLGRPTLDFIDSKIIAPLDREPFDSANSLAEAIGVSHSTMLRHLQNSLGTKNF